ncbi:hypothetical protein [Nostoc sp. CCY 9925]|uniref:hypothetical protein n=1 Tax=Nostoc sp. CCY 9925 TaxID=3103865 RepID=UPI0039C7606D
MRIQKDEITICPMQGEIYDYELMAKWLIPILYEDAPNYIRNEPQRAHRRGAASRRVGHKERRKEAKRIWRSFTKKWYNRSKSFGILGRKR